MFFGNEFIRFCTTFSEFGFVRNQLTELKQEISYGMLTGNVTKTMELSAGDRAIECAVHCFEMKCSGFKINNENLCDIYN